MAQNAQKLQEASELYDEAEKEIAKKEKSLGISSNPSVRNRMKLYKTEEGRLLLREQEGKTHHGGCGHCE